MTPVDFSCMLPVLLGWSPDAGAFLSFPDVTVTPAGKGGYSFDRVVSRWLPVTKNAISPDGRLYAYTEGFRVDKQSPPRVHIVDAATDGDVHVFSMPDAQPYAVLEFRSANIYLGIRYEGTVPGVWSMDRTTGAVTKVSDTLYAPDAEWFGVVDARDPSPDVDAEGGTAAPNRLDHRDASGRVTTWFYRPGHSLGWIPFAGSRTVLVQAVLASPSLQTVEYWLVTGPNAATELIHLEYREAGPDLYNGFYRAVVDAHGIWMGGTQSLYLVTPAGRILRVYDQHADPAGTCE